MGWTEHPLLADVQRARRLNTTLSVDEVTEVVRDVCEAYPDRKRFAEGTWQMTFQRTSPPRVTWSKDGWPQPNWRFNHGWQLEFGACKAATVCFNLAGLTVDKTGLRKTAYDGDEMLRFYDMVLRAVRSRDPAADLTTEAASV